MHKVYYQPEGIWVGDIMPYGEDGTFYLYHQRDTRNPEPFGEPFGWALATTKFPQAGNTPCASETSFPRHTNSVQWQDMSIVFICQTFSYQYVFSQFQSSVNG